MKTNFLKFSVAVAFVSFGLFFGSCQKENNENVTSDDISVVRDDADAANASDDVDNEVDFYARQVENNNFSTTKSAEVTDDACKPMITVDKPNDTTMFPKVITVDFGAGCTGHNGKTKKGKIIITITKRWRIAGASRSITFQDFYVNDRKIEGTRTVTNNGKNTAGNWNMSIEVDCKITRNDTSRTFKSSRVREWISGFETPLVVADDKFSITGTASGVNRKGVAYTSEITKALIVTPTCRWITAGEIKINVPTKDKEIVVNYGDGSCGETKVITITVNGVVKEVTLGE